MTKRALITGITGQDGSYLAELLLERGYEVHGIKRRASSFNTQRVDHLYQAARELGITLAFAGQGVDETAVVRAVEGDKAPAVKVGDVIVSVDPRYFRPAEVETLLGDASKAQADLGWVPKITLSAMVNEMVASDLASAQRSRFLKVNGYASHTARSD